MGEISRFFIAHPPRLEFLEHRRAAVEIEDQGIFRHVAVEEAEELSAAVKASGKIFGLMHNYTAYPMVKLAKDMVKQGDLGKIRKVVVQYPQGWLARAMRRSAADLMMASDWLRTRSCTLANCLLPKA